MLQVTADGGPKTCFLHLHMLQTCAVYTRVTISDSHVHNSTFVKLEGRPPLFRPPKKSGQEKEAEEEREKEDRK